MAKKIDDGGPAFPYDWIKTEDGKKIHGWNSGMSLRDWFAGQALAGVLAAQADPGVEVLLDEKSAAKEAYAYADAMLAARKEKP